jgi:hypothetical protein
MASEGRITEMKRFIASVVVGFVTSCGAGFAAQVSAGKLDSLSLAADLFHWRGANKIIKQLSSELSTADLTPDQAMKKLDKLYSNPKYGELDLGQAFQLLVTIEL